MKEELEKKLYEKYPKIFRQKDLDKTETAMCWGICCGDGWYSLIDNACDQLQFNTDRNGHPQVEFTQVKEKYGTLRLYFRMRADPPKRAKPLDWLMDKFVKISHYMWHKDLISADFILGHHNADIETGEIMGVLDAAEYASGTVCEMCGQPGKIVSRGHWDSTLCKKHADELGYSDPYEEPPEPPKPPEMKSLREDDEEGYRKMKEDKQ